MRFTLTRTLLRSLHCVELPAGQEPEDSLRYAPVFSEDLPQEFAVVFDLKKPLKPSRQLTLSYATIFEALDELTPELKESHFTRVNAPAVGYPYLRAFVGQFAALGGFDPCILPIKNFMAGKILPPLPQKTEASAPPKRTRRLPPPSGD